MILSANNNTIIKYKIWTNESKLVLEKITSLWIPTFFISRVETSKGLISLFDPNGKVRVYDINNISLIRNTKLGIGYI